MAAQTPDGTPKLKDRNWFAIALSSIGFVGLVGVILLLLTHLLQVLPILLWGILTALIVSLLVGLGLGTNGKWYGVLIDSRNRASLSRAQITLWTILALSAYLTIALVRSRPGALPEPKAKDIELCITQRLQSAAGEQEIATWRVEHPEEAKIIQVNAAGECAAAQPLQITFPTELLLALGISTTSFAGSNLVQSLKRNRKDLELITGLKKKEQEAEALANAKKAAWASKNQVLGEAKERLEQARQQTSPEAGKLEAVVEYLIEELDQANQEQVEAMKAWEVIKAQREVEEREIQGLLKVNEKPEQAALGEIFRGDEIGNYSIVDLSKVQMFLFTVALLVAYGTALGGLLQNSAALFNPLGVDLPPFSSSLNTLLAISHAGYLSVKSIDQTKTT